MHGDLGFIPRTMKNRKREIHEKACQVFNPSAWEAEPGRSRV